MSSTIPLRAENGVPYWIGSAIVPGWGQLCQERFGTALVSVVCIPILYWLAWPWAVALHAWCIIDAWAWAAKETGARGKAGA